MKKSFINSILFISLFGGLFYTIGVPEVFSVITEILIYFLFAFSIISRQGRSIYLPHLWFILVLFGMATVTSVTINNTPMLRSLSSLRLLFRFYIFYLGIIYINPSESVLKKINTFILILLILQFPVIAIKFMKYGISEKTMGAYAVHSGSIATMLPISLIFYLSSYYFIYENRSLFLFTGLGYIVFSIIAMKRAIFFLYPIQYFFIYHFIYVKQTNVKTSNKFITLCLGLLFIIIVLGSIMHFNAFLNPENEVGGSVDLEYVMDFANEYNYGVNGYGESYGRLATTKRIVEILSEAGFWNIAFGLGPSYTTTSPLDSAKAKEIFRQNYRKLKIKYGMTSATKILIEFGVVGVAFYSAILILLFKMSWSLYLIENDRYWKAYAVGSVCFSFSMFIFFIIYNPSGFWGDTMPALYFYSMAVVFLRKSNLYEMTKDQIKTKIINLEVIPQYRIIR